MLDSNLACLPVSKSDFTGCCMGFVIDTLMSDHINVLCRNGFFSLYRISKIRNLLDRPTTEKLVHAFVTSQIDYCNSLLFGISKLQLARLQSLQNAASRLIHRTRRFESITPVLKDLHWLPITARIRFKILLITFKIILGIAPMYLRDLVKLYVPARDLRSNGSLLLIRLDVEAISTKCMAKKCLLFMRLCFGIICRLKANLLKTLFVLNVL